MTDFITCASPSCDLPCRANNEQQRGSDISVPSFDRHYLACLTATRVDKILAIHAFISQFVLTTRMGDDMHQMLASDNWSHLQSLFRANAR